MRAYGAAVEQACPPSTLHRLTLMCYRHAIQDQAHLEEQMRLQLTLDDLPWSVELTDADLLDLVYESSDLFELTINEDWAWRLDDGSDGITLDGVVELLRYCESPGEYEASYRHANIH